MSDLGNLILTRKAGQSIVIGNGQPYETRVLITSIDGERAKVAVTAPRSVKVVRGELLEEIAVEGSGDNARRYQRSQRGGGDEERANYAPISGIEDDRFEYLLEREHPELGF